MQKTTLFFSALFLISQNVHAGRKYNEKTIVQQVRGSTIQALSILDKHYPLKQNDKEFVEKLIRQQSLYNEQENNVEIATEFDNELLAALQRAEDIVSAIHDYYPEENDNEPEKQDMYYSDYEEENVEYYNSSVAKDIRSKTRIKYLKQKSRRYKQKHSKNS